ncbi:DUF6268 family outer membrane beta-barrel protein [Winogradskyella poriferorum]|uniref:DUF6268 family outer membrane beta-barrel protein n=1 Tax=Winogradskyella poriferorum TaxID=307627 RepID=A0ABU7W6H9_9FLAO
MKKIILHIIIVNAMVNAVAGQDLGTEKETKTSLNLFYDLYPTLNSVDLDTKGFVFNTIFTVPKGELGIGAAYTYNMLNSDTYTWSPELMAFGDFHQIQLLMNYNYTINNKWSLGVEFSPLITSTLETSLQSNAIVLESQVELKRILDQKAKPSYLSVGLAYGTELGAPKIYPTLSYFNTVNEKLSYKLGFPETAIYYRLNNQSKFDFTVAPQSVYTLHNQPLYDNNLAADVTDSYLEFTALQSSLRYHFDFNNNWSSFFKIGYTTSSTMKIKALDTDNTIYDFKADNGFMVGFGLNFNINNNK